MLAVWKFLLRFGRSLCPEAIRPAAIRAIRLRPEAIPPAAIPPAAPHLRTRPWVTPHFLAFNPVEAESFNQPPSGRAWARLGILLGLGLSLWLGCGGGLVAWAALPPGNAITDGYALLRYALPIDSADLRNVQTPLETLSSSLRGKRWPAVTKAIQKSERVLSTRQGAIIDAIPEGRRAEAQTKLDAIRGQLADLEAAAIAKDKSQTQLARNQVLQTIGEVEELMIEGMPFTVPDQYRHLPQLQGRATVELVTTKGTLLTIVDGYNAPLSAGNFVDLVQRGFYDGLPFTRSDDGYVVQAGDPPGSEDGFIDPKTKQLRTVPLEIRAEDSDEILYGTTFEDAGLFLEDPVLPFSAFGSMGMARPGSDLNGGSSQFFFFLFEPELTPAGANLIDGRYAAFGYVVEGKSLLDELRQGDKIISAKVVSGAEHLLPGRV